MASFYCRWFLRRLEEGFCEWMHPFGGGIRRVSLRPEDCLAIVFWTRNPTPLLPALRDIRAAGHVVCFHVTLTGYPREIEERSPRVDSAVRGIRALAEMVGPEAVTWRYDPIVLGPSTPEAYHLERFSELAARIAGATSRAYFSFVSMYGKTRRNFDRVAAAHGFTFEEPTAERKKELSLRLRDVASRHGMTLHACCEDALVGDGIEKGHCVDLDLLRTLRPDISERLERRPTRKQCGCTESVDIGAYDTCPYGCAYCYATQSREAALSRFREHDPDDTFLWRPPRLRTARPAPAHPVGPSAP